MKRQPDGVHGVPYADEPDARRVAGLCTIGDGKSLLHGHCRQSHGR